MKEGPFSTMTQLAEKTSFLTTLAWSGMAWFTLASSAAAEEAFGEAEEEVVGVSLEAVRRMDALVVVVVVEGGKRMQIRQTSVCQIPKN